jgi:hypothetical protein
LYIYYGCKLLLLRKKQFFKICNESLKNQSCRAGANYYPIKELLHLLSSPYRTYSLLNLHLQSLCSCVPRDSKAVKPMLTRSSFLAAHPLDKNALIQSENTPEEIKDEIDLFYRTGPG